MNDINTIPREFYIVVLQRKSAGKTITHYINYQLGHEVNFSSANLFIEKTKACSAAASITAGGGPFNKAFVLTITSPFKVEEIVPRPHYTVGTPGIIG